MGQDWLHATGHLPIAVTRRRPSPVTHRRLGPMQACWLNTSRAGQAPGHGIVAAAIEGAMRVDGVDSTVTAVTAVAADSEEARGMLRRLLP